MCEQTSHVHSVFCALPPQILRRVAENGTVEQREAALQTLAADSTFRTLRAVRLAAPVAIPAAVAVADEMQRTISDAQNTTALPGMVVRSEGASETGDPAVDEAYDGLGDTYQFYREMLDRNSIDDQGMPLNATVHYGRRYDNAYWDGRRMVFGDGDGVLFNRFTFAVDVMAHEMTHGVTEFETQLVYSHRPGALNESLSDVFGSLVKQYRNGKQAAEDADWLIGEGLLAENVQGVALRSMKEPGTAFDDPVLGKDPQPGHVDDFVNTEDDNGGVHINSGIPNRAFYLAAVALGGYAGEKAGPIWYAAMRDPRMKPNSGFRRFARLTAINAWNLFPDGEEHRIVQDAWRQVGVQI
jgi:Zn-dependent metalloprotease